MALAAFTAKINEQVLRTAEHVLLSLADGGTSPGRSPANGANGRCEPRGWRGVAWRG